MKKVEDLIEKICPELEDKKVQEPVRLGKLGGNRPRLLRVKMKSVQAKKEILRNAPKVNKDVKDPKDKIFINPDYTPAEREKQKELRAELKRLRDSGQLDWKIRGEKLVRGKPPMAGQSGQSGQH